LDNWKLPNTLKKEAYRALITVKPEEFKQWLHALLVMEEFGRKMAVEELHAIPNGLVQSWTRERRIKWLKVQLKHKVAIRTASRVRETVKLSWHAQQTTEWGRKNSEPYLPSTSSSLKRRYSAGRSSSTTSMCTFTRRYSQTPGLGRTARATKGGSTMASYTKQKTDKMTKKKKLKTKTHKTYPEYNTPDKENTKGEEVTCVDLKTSPKAPSCSFFLFSSGISSSSATTWWCCRIPLPLASSLLFQQDC